MTKPPADANRNSTNRNSANHNSTDDLEPGRLGGEPPRFVRFAGMLGVAEGAAGIAFAVFLAVRELFGSHDSGAVFTDQQRGLFLAYGTSVFFLVIFGVVTVAGVNLMRGKRWGRGPVAMLNMLLLPIAYYIVSSGQWFWAVPVACAALGGLFLLFHPDSVKWASAIY